MASEPDDCSSTFDIGTDAMASSFSDGSIAAVLETWLAAIVVVVLLRGPETRN